MRVIRPTITDASQPKRMPEPRMNTAASETLPAGSRSTGTGYASAKIAAASRTTMPAALPADGGALLYPQTAAPRAAAPASVTGRKIGNSLRVSALPRPQLRLLPDRTASGADSITAPDLPEEAVQRSGLAERRGCDDRHDHERRKLESPVHHDSPFLLALPQSPENEPQLVRAI